MTEFEKELINETYDEHFYDVLFNIESSIIDSFGNLPTLYDVVSDYDSLKSNIEEEEELYDFQ